MASKSGARVGAVSVALFVSAAGVPASAQADSVAPLSSFASDVDTSGMIRNVNTPQPTDWRPSPADEEEPLGLFLLYRGLLRAGNHTAAYRLLAEVLRAEVSPENMRAMDQSRGWYLGPIKLTRMTWYPDPAGAAPGLYVAMDFASVPPDGGFQCGYVMAYRPAGATAFAISRVDSSQIEANVAASEQLPAVLSALPCWLGPDVVTALNPG